MNWIPIYGYVCHGILTHGAALPGLALARAPLVPLPLPHAPPPCDTPGVNFASCREINPNLECSVKISISRSCLSLFIRLSLGSSSNSELIDRGKQPILERVKTFISRNECKLDDQSRFINLI
jgi:hypothetical protein